jgi:hypothetical protein
LLLGARGYLTRRTEKAGLVLIGLGGSLLTVISVLFYIMPFYFG